MIVCGGDTSSRVTRLLGIHSLSIAANPWGNVVLLRAHASAGSALDGARAAAQGQVRWATATLFDDVRRASAPDPIHAHGRPRVSRPDVGILLSSISQRQLTDLCGHIHRAGKRAPSS